MGGIYWLASYPKSGNTWLRAFLCNLQENGEVPVDLNQLQTGSIASARGWLDEVLGFDTAELAPDEVERLRPFVYRWSSRDEVIGYHKIHDALTLTVDAEPIVSREATRGAIYIIRNPLDVAPSASAFWSCTIDQAIDHLNRSGWTLCGSRHRLPPQVRQRLGSWSEHVVSWVDVSDFPVEVLRYEDMLSDPLPTFTRAARFLDLPHDCDRVAKAIRFSEFQELARQEQEKGFRERPQRMERFFRRGRSGGWREQLTEEQIGRIISAHSGVMQRFGYLDEQGKPV